jgi:hypothetical protein
MGILWAAYQAGSMPAIPPDTEQQEFADLALGWLERFQSAFIVEDKTTVFRDGKGPVGMYLVTNDGFVIKPFWVPFKWATKRNILRSIVGFIQYIKYSSDVGLCVFLTTEAEKPMMMRQKRYGHNLWFVGNSPYNEIWCIAGRQKTPRA